MVIRDVRTRWNWTYCMIKHGLELRDAINHWTITVDKGRFEDLKIKNSEWDDLEKIAGILKV
ncbi:hypothetical protein IW261DRAFT_1338970 [Armillaria novae-zelandiae]|uniref:Uncharacterized protein n=1 Tax=Armillaria novae-zelandiae TaxID=153914 RepID=A0AA39P437_9AGAR|nr:hypothetical protein IW261DRAFT_1347532 [Armillaria novae-zelandiae]KAK0477114.1 hypothetical protein IW261DRAFT_1338970 [Armillaria novae-zelandiae]